MTYIKLLTVLTGLALLTACGGAAPPNNTDNDKTGGTAVSCDTNPFGSTCLADTNLNPRRVEIVSDCRTDKMGELCTDAIEFVCEQNYRDPICVGTAKYDNLIQMEETTCLTNNSKEFCDNQARITTCDASPFPDNCIEPKYVMQRRIECESLKNKSQCMATEELICGMNGDVFDPFCNGITNYVSVRETTCQTHGTDPDDGDSSCATILIPLCVIADPFAHAGCDNVEGINANIRTPYCQTPANAWKPKCMDGMHGAVTATRVTACQMFGTGMGGDNSCATSLASSCTITDPFAYTGCKDVAGIAGVRMMYCEDSATAWDEECMDGIHGTVVSFRTIACLESPFNDPANPLCLTDSFTEAACRMNPFASANPGCANLTDYKNIVKTYCATNDVVACPNVTTADWLASFEGAEALPTTPNTTPTNEFLAITATTASTLTAELVPTTLFITGSTTNGAAFFTENGAYYAGVLAGTDLGTPITETITSAIWTGKINAVTNDARVGLVGTDFNLVINFNGGTRTVNAMVHVGFAPRYFSIDGTFDEKGVIEGTVTYGETTGTGDNIAFDVDHATYSPGNLTGIIGVDGAVGAFYNDNANPAAGGGALKYSGGFVVLPPRLVANYADWLGSFSPAPPATLTAGENQFLAGGTAGLSTSGATNATPDSLTIASARYEGEKLGGTGNINDGVAFFYDTVSSGNYNYYAGLLSDTNLGALITRPAGTTAKWRGQLKAFRDAGTIATDDTEATDNTGFVLDITFTGNTGSIESYAEVGTGIYYHLDGTYNAQGVISGTVERGIFIFTGETLTGFGTSSDGILTGLIGEQGAVGVFIADDDADPAYVGGFVAAPIRNIPDYDTFVRHYEPQKNADNTKLLERQNNPNRLNQFLKGQESGILFPLSVETQLIYTATGHFEPVALKLEGDSVNGIGLMRAFAEVQQMKELHRSGILLGTDLGAPLTGNETDANWSGKLYVTRHVNASDENKPIAIDLELAVDFSAGTIGTATPVTTAPNETVAINGTFGAGDITLPAGIMGGTVSYNDGATTYHALPLIGLIGEDGAIGVFHGGEGVLLPMAGGFIVKPPAPSGS